MTKSLKLSKSTFSAINKDLLKHFISKANKFQMEFSSILSEHGLPLETVVHPSNNIDQIITNIFEKFHTVAQTLLSRPHNKTTFIIEDEYDVQHLLHPLLRLYFEDIRREEPIESLGGTYSKIDFLLRKEQIGIEVKMAYEGHANKEIKEEITLDKDFYRRHSNCKKLFCFIYDPRGLIKNPKGFENDLSDNISGLEAKVFIRPK